MTAKPKVTKQTRRRSSTARIVWRDVTAKVRHTHDYLLDGQDHVEVMVVAPAGAVLPITETGYRSHFLPAEELAAAGGAVRFVLDLLDREARTRRWQATEFRWRQLDMFG